MPKPKAKRFLSDIKTYSKGQTDFFPLGYDSVSDKSNLLVNCSATKHVITDKSKSIDFDQNFEPGNHFVELADGSRVNSIVLKRGSVCIFLHNSKGNMCRCILINALYIPTFKQNIFLQAATKKMVHLSFEYDNCRLIYPNGVAFNITQRTFVLSEKYHFCQKCHLWLTYLTKSWATLMNLILKSYLSKRNEDKTDSKLCS